MISKLYFKPKIIFKKTSRILIQFLKFFYTGGIPGITRQLCFIFVDCGARRDTDGAFPIPVTIERL